MNIVIKILRIGRHTIYVDSENIDFILLLNIKIYRRTLSPNNFKYLDKIKPDSIAGLSPAKYRHLITIIVQTYLKVLNL